MNITITNVSSPPVAIFVSDLYTTIQPGAVVTTQRALSQLSAMTSLQNYVAAGQLTLVIAADTNEIESGTLAPISPLFVVQEWDAPATASATGVMLSTATVSGTVTYTLVAGSTAIAGSIVNPATLATGGARNVTITGGGTTGQCPTSAVVTGLDALGNAQTETLALTAGSATGSKGWSSFISVQFLGGTGTAGTEEIGFGVKLGLFYPPKLRAGQTSPLTPVFPEIVDGAVLSTGFGTIDTVNHSFTPATAPNGTHQYALYYEAAQ
jgi:hypothetical protein